MEGPEVPQEDEIAPPGRMLRSMTCPACGSETSPTARFCATCGRALRGPEDERRIVTVLFADIVGFTTMSERLDPEQVKNLVDRCFDLLAVEVEAFGGRVDKIVGDAFIVLFGAPIAHEDDAERAVRAGLRLHEVLRTEAGKMGHDLSLRVGINTGEVLVGAMRAAGSITAMGDVVNTAARLQSVAGPGEVVVGSATRDATVGAIAYEDLGTRELRGREDPVGHWRAIAPITAPGQRRRRRDLPLIGRDGELALLNRAVDMSFANRRALFLLLAADVGLGKSRLATEVSRRAELEHGAVAREGRCLPYGEANVWWPIAEMLRVGVDLRPDADPSDVEKRLTEHVRRVLPDSTSDTEADRVAAGLLTVIGIGAAGDVDAGQTAAEAVRSLVAYSDALVERVPLVLQISDLHFADDALLGLIEKVMAELHNRPVVVVATARPGLLEQWQPSSGRHNSLVLHLDPLDRVASAALLHELIGRPVPDDFAEELLDRAGGNPFFLEELVSLVDVSTSDTGTVSIVAADGDPATLAEVRGHAGEGAFAHLGRGRALPVTLHGLVTARLDDLATDARTVLQDAAVIGRRGPVDGLAHLVRYAHPDEPIDIHASLGVLVDEDLLEIEGNAWSFRSDLVRDVAYQTLTKVDRARSHHGIAGFLEHETANRRPQPIWLVDQLATHWGAAAALTHEIGAIAPIAEIPDDVTERARHWAVVAARRAHREGSLPTAVRRYRQAIELTEHERPDPAVLADLHLQLADVALESWDAETARHAVEAARTLIDDPASVLAARAATVAGRIGQRVGATDDAVEQLVEAVRIFDRLGDAAGAARALRARALTELLGGRERDARRSAEAALRAYEDIDEPLGRGWARQHLGWVSMLEGDLDAADQLLEQSITDFETAADTRGLAWARGLVAWVRHRRRRLDEALSIGTDAYAEARTRRDPWATAMMTMLLGAVHLDRGEIGAALELLQESHDDFARLGSRYGRDRSGALLGRALVASGRIDEGFDLLDRVDTGGVAADSTAATVEEIRLLTAAEIGEPERVGGPASIERVRHGRGDDPFPAAAVLLLQCGDLDGAARALGPDTGRDRVDREPGKDAMLDDRNTDPQLLAARALWLTAVGRDGAHEIAEVVPDLIGSGPVEIVWSLIADAVRSAATGDADRATERTRAALEVAAATDDRNLEPLLELIAAEVALITGRIGAEEAVATAERGLEEAKLRTDGWRAYLRLATSATI